MPEADHSPVSWRLAKDLVLAETEAASASAIAYAASRLSQAERVRVWLFDRTRGYRLSASWPEESDPPEEPPDDLARALVSTMPFVTGSEANGFRSRLLVPLLSGRRPIGALELFERDRASGPFSFLDGEALGSLVDLSESSLSTLRQRNMRDRGHIDALARMTRLFDFDRMLLTTLEQGTLVRMVVERVRSALEVDSVYLWVADDSGEELTLAANAGGAFGEDSPGRIAKGAGAVGGVAASGEAALFEDPEEIPEFGERPDVRSGASVRSVIAAPVIAEGGECLGVLEAVSGNEERFLRREDLAFLREAADTTAFALGHARRLDAERRASDLGTILETAQELASNLEVPKVCFTLVHRAAAVLRYRRAAVGLLQRGRLALAAVSGQTFVDETLPEMKLLRDILSWAADLDEGIYVVQDSDGTIDADRAETREKFRTYFEASTSRSFLAIPLLDEEGRLGVFSLESEEPFAFTERSLEAARLLAVQAVQAIRNATLVQQIPMARVFGPLDRSRRRYLSLPFRKKAVWAGALLGGAALLFVPVPLRVGGEVRVLPARRLPVTAQVTGRVAQVLVREGDRVDEGQVLALLDETDVRLGEAAVDARYEVAVREQSRLRAEGNTAAAAIGQARVDGLRAEKELWEARLSATRIRAHSSGVVATPRVEEKVGSELKRGDLFCEVVDPVRQRLEVAVLEGDVGLVREDLPVKFKLHAYPEKSFAARVERVGVSASLVGTDRVFLVQARLLGEPVPFRAGMTGQAKIDTGPASLIRVVLRQPARWIWSLLWGWLP